MLRAIALFKLVKVALLVCAGIGAFKFLDPAVEERVTHWAESLAWTFDHGIIHSALARLTGLNPLKLKALGIGAFLYAVLFAIEGIGLWFERRWAEYLTLVATGSFLPFELYEICLKVTLPRLLALILNVIVVAYLASVVRHAAHRKEDRDPSA